MAIQNYYDSHLYSCVVRIFLLKKRSVVFKLLFLLLPKFLRGENDFLALESLVSIFGSMSPSVAILEPRYVNSFPSSTAFPCRMIGASRRWFILICLGIPTLTLSPSSEAIDTRSYSWPAWLCGNGLGGRYCPQSQGHWGVGREFIWYLCCALYDPERGKGTEGVCICCLYNERLCERVSVDDLSLPVTVQNPDNINYLGWYFIVSQYAR